MNEELKCTPAAFVLPSLALPAAGSTDQYEKKNSSTFLTNVIPN